MRFFSISHFAWFTGHWGLCHRTHAFPSFLVSGMLHLFCQSSVHLGSHRLDSSFYRFAFLGCTLVYTPAFLHRFSSRFHTFHYATPAHTRSGSTAVGSSCTASWFYLLPFTGFMFASLLSASLPCHSLLDGSCAKNSALPHYSRSSSSIP